MFQSEILRMLRLFRCAALQAALSGLLGAGPRHLVWQTGRWRLDPDLLADPQTWYGSPEYADSGRHHSHDDSPAAVSEGIRRFPNPYQVVRLRVHLIISSTQGTYTVEHTMLSPVPKSLLAIMSVVSLSRYTGSPQQVLPWLAHLPSSLPFAVHGRSLYYRDAQGKQHKGSIVQFVPS